MQIKPEGEANEHKEYCVMEEADEKQGLFFIIRS